MTEGPQKRRKVENSESRPLTTRFDQIRKSAPPLVQTKETFASRWQRILENAPSLQLIKRAQNTTAWDTFPVMVAENGKSYAVFNEQLTKGSSCSIKLVKDLDSGKLYAMKVSTDGKEKALQEKMILEKLNQFEAIQFKTTKRGVERSYLVMELIPGITLENFKSLSITHEITLSFKEKAHILLSMLEAIKILIDKKINHGDVHEGNIMFNPLTLKTQFVDFGDATETEGSAQDHHQFYDIRKLLKALEPFLEPTLVAITQKHLNSWANVDLNLLNAINDVSACVENASLAKENRCKN